ncbi:MAG: glycosyl hydrolase family 28-related protein [Lentisphaeria bacterium]|nr:glycosyl hydrolase family 28-related protein [Lentisphaeria bacterium]
MKYLNPSIVMSAAALFLISACAHLRGDPSTEVEMPKQYVNVADFEGTANERIEAAITAAMETGHKTVFFPNGEYLLRHGLNLNRGLHTELHLVGESRDGVRLTPDIEYLVANYNDGNFQDGNGKRLAHMINLSAPDVFDFVDVSIQNMTLDMKSQAIYYQPVTYNVVGHGIRVGTGWRKGQFKVDRVTIMNVAGYGIGIQDRGGHPKNNMTLTNLHIERTGSDGIDTKEASGEGNRNLVIRDVTVKDIGYTDTGAAPALDIRYRTVIMERVKLISAGSRTLPDGKRNNIAGINFRPEGNVLSARVSDVYAKGFTTAIHLHAAGEHQHKNIHISDFKIHDYSYAGICVRGSGHAGHTISDGHVHSGGGKALMLPEQGVTIRNVAEGPWPNQQR